MSGSRGWEIPLSLGEFMKSHQPSLLANHAGERKRWGRKERPQDGMAGRKGGGFASRVNSPSGGKKNGKSWGER